MSEEEKKAIKWLKELYDIEKDFNSSAGKEESNIIKTLLNLIEKQRKEIKELKEEHNSKYYHTIKLKELENEINNDWENKIKAEIKKLEQMELEEDETFGNMRDYAILILKELLGE